MLVYLLELEQPWKYLCQGIKVPRNIVESSDPTRFALNMLNQYRYKLEFRATVRVAKFRLVMRRWLQVLIELIKGLERAVAEIAFISRSTEPVLVYRPRNQSTLESLSPVDRWSIVLIHEFLFTEVSALIMHTLARASSLAKLCEKTKHQLWTAFLVRWLSRTALLIKLQLQL